MKKGNKKYSIFSNYFYIYQGLWQFDKKAVFLAAAEVLFQVATAFGAIWMSSKIIHMLEVGMSVREMILTTMELFVGYGIIAAIARYLQSRNEWQYIEYRGGVMIRKSLRKVMSMDYEQYEREDIQKLVEKSAESVSTNMTGIEGILHRTVTLLTDILGLILYSVVISEVHPLVIVLLLGISLIQIGTFRLANAYELRNKEKKAQLKIHQDYLDRQAYEINAGKDIRLYQLQDWLTKRYMQANRCYQRLIAKERVGYFANDLAGLILQFFRDALCYGYLIYLLQQGMSASRFVLYIGIVSGFATYFTSMTSEITEITRHHKLVDFYREAIDLKQEFHHGDGERLDLSDQTLEVEFSHVTYSYPGNDKKVIDDLSFRIGKGEKLALVGVNGAGKTTIVKLMCGFYRPQSGHIYVNGIDLADLDLEEYYNDLAVVFQDSLTLSCSIAENVTCQPEGEYDRTKCIEALKQAGLWEKIDSLPKKERTFLNKDFDEEGIQLSGGQLQKLMLARALYKECRLLLLDEPTAALDAIAENEMYEKYQELIADRTALFISHRLASTRFCDHILLLENGKIKESGTHEELMQQKGSYANMFEVQSKYYKEGEEDYEEDLA